VKNIVVENKPEWISIQVLRGLAALIVVMGHSVGKLKHEYQTSPEWLLNVWKVSALGVDVFFILSGLVMVLVSNQAASSYQYSKKFLLNRIIRIFPIYWIALSLFLLLKFIADGGGGTLQLGTLFRSFLLLPVITDDGKFHPLLGVGWTLIFEMFFYYVFSLLLFKNSFDRVRIITLVFIILSFLGLYTNSSSPFVVFYTSPLTLEFASGMIIGLLIKENKLLRVKWGLSIIFLSLLLFGLSHLLDSPYVSFENINKWRFVFWGGPAFLLVYGCVSCERLFKHILFSVFKKIGDSSYSLYLFHAAVILPALGAIFSYLSVYKLVSFYEAFFIMIVSCIIGSYVIHYYLEKPLTNKLKKALLD
jgi:exopolysaccharide production protein ExoZ